MKSLLRLALAMAAAAWMQGAAANDQREYEIRVGSELAILFDSLDRNRDAQVSREEARGDLNFLPLFEDIDVNRNDRVTRGELRGYLELRYGSHSAAATRQAFAPSADTAERMP